MTTCLGKSGGVRLGRRQNKSSIFTNAPCCIAIILLNCTAYIEILILPLVLLAAKADVCVGGFMFRKILFLWSEACRSQKMDPFCLLFQWRKLASNNRASISNTNAAPPQPCRAAATLQLFLSRLVNTAKYSLAHMKRSLNHYLSGSGLLSMQALQQHPAPNLKQARSPSEAHPDLCKSHYHRIKYSWVLLQNILNEHSRHWRHFSKQLSGFFFLEESHMYISSTSVAIN